MALSRRERRPSFRPAELLGGTSTGRRMDRKTTRQPWQAVRRSPARGGDAAGDCPESAGCGNRPPLPCPMETWRRCGTAHCWSGRREGGARSSVALRSAAVRESLRSEAPEPELELKRRLRARSREVSSGEKRPWREGLAEGRQDHPEPRAGEPRPAGDVGRPCSLGSQARPSPARRS